MRKLIRSKATKAFLTKDGLWTDSVQDAQAFMYAIEAVARKDELGLTNVELYFLNAEHKTSDHDFVLPL